MDRVTDFLLDGRTLAAFGITAPPAVFALATEHRYWLTAIALAAVALIAAAWAAARTIRRRRTERTAHALEQAIESQAAGDAATPARVPGSSAALQAGLLQALQRIKSSRLGQLSGTTALYALPWYIVIGNPAAGKSSAITRSGLAFPFAEGGNAAVTGVSGTRHCDWFFTSEGILIDTAGRYAVHDEDRGEWLGFLSLLKRHRPLAPVNGVVVAVSLGELTTSDEARVVALAHSLRQRVQELTSELEVLLPVYLLFTKADLVAGFRTFFAALEDHERERVWGATLPYDQAQRGKAAALFESRFDELHEGVKAMSAARMTHERGRTGLPLEILTLPMEFAALKPRLRAFVSSLFEENPYQFQPVFRGFYFTSAMQEGIGVSPERERVAQRFALEAGAAPCDAGASTSESGYFLRDLFSRVIFADRALVKQVVTPARHRRRACFVGASVLLLGGALAAWSWSHAGNRQLVAAVHEDLRRVRELQAASADIGRRLEALEILQDRIERLRLEEAGDGIGLRLGLFQGRALREGLERAYYAGIGRLMLEPVKQSIEARLREAGTSGTATAEDGRQEYNALKTYLMLAQPDRRETTHLADQLTRHWRGWLERQCGAAPRDAIVRSAARLVAYAAAHAQHPALAPVTIDLALASQTRERLRDQMRGMKPAERMYYQLIAAAQTRFAPATVASILGAPDKPLLAGSQVVRAAYTRAAWEQMIRPALREADPPPSMQSDWVLAGPSDGPLADGVTGNAWREQLEALYRSEHGREWQQFLQGVTVRDIADLDEAISVMGQLGDPASPILKLLDGVAEQSALPSGREGDARQERRSGAIGWLRDAVAPRKPQAPGHAASTSTERPAPDDLSVQLRALMTRNDGPAPIAAYLQSLTKVHARLQQIRNQGDPGPGACTLLKATLSGADSEPAQALKLVDEQLLGAAGEPLKNALRPLLVRPLAGALAATVRPAEAELNRTWVAEVHRPFQQALAGKQPFDPRSQTEAPSSEIERIFGPRGAVARYVGETLGPLVTRRGDTLEARNWGGVGIRLRPRAGTDMPLWLAPVDTAAAVGAGQTLFQVMPDAGTHVRDYTVVIDGQTLQRGEGSSHWVDMVWPNDQGTPGVAITAVADDGQAVELVHEAGGDGFARMVERADQRKLGDGTTRLTWKKGPLSVSMLIRVVKRPGSSRPGAAAWAGLRLPETIVGTADAAPGATR
jgi:type VI secretion system protein ImpL